MSVKFKQKLVNSILLRNFKITRICDKQITKYTAIRISKKIL